MKRIFPYRARYNIWSKHGSGWYIVLRQEAIKIIIENDITKLARDEREAMLLNSWGIGEDDPEFHFFRSLCRMNC